MNGEDGDDTWLTGWEQECAESIENQPDYDQNLAGENENFQRKVWTSFQDSATAIAQLYRDRYTGEPATIWLQFQTAAGTVTALYKDSCESLKKTTELARQSGYQKRNNELLHWAKRKRRLIRREDLLAYLAGKPPPPRQSHHHHHHGHHRMDILEDFDLIYDPDGELIDLIEENNQDREYNLRERIDHFNKWNNEEFFNRFRLSKPTVNVILEQIAANLRNRTEWNLHRSISTIDKLLLTLRFLATGDFYITMGDFTGIHKTTAGKIIKQGIIAIGYLFPQYIHLPQTEENQQEAKRDFYNISHFPRVIGAIDCTHIKIQSPGGDNAEVYRNRKGYFSLNCQVTCSAKLKIIDLVCRWPGSAHDSNIFENSALKIRMHNGEMGNGVLLGDRGYTLRPYILTPLDNPQNEAENLYNEAQIRTRNVIERLFGIWKRRFPVLSTGIRCKMELAQRIVVACAVLHNIAIEQNEEYIGNDNNIDLDGEHLPEGNEGNSARMPFIDYFQNLINNRNN